MLNRRELLFMMAAGVVMTAEGVWMPGRKLISIPKGHLIGLHNDYISLVDDYSARVLCSAIRGVKDVHIEGGIAKIVFPQITRGLGVGTSIYVGKCRVFDVDIPILTEPGISVEATISDLPTPKGHWLKDVHCDVVGRL